MTKYSLVKLDRKNGLYLKDTQTKGRGLFCTHNIKAGEELETTPAIILNEAANRQTDKTILFNYVFSTGGLSKKLREKTNIQDPDTASAVVMGIASFCNHCSSPNAEIVWMEKKGTLYYSLRATRDISKNTEICTSYGDNWFDDRKI